MAMRRGSCSSFTTLLPTTEIRMCMVVSAVRVGGERERECAREKEIDRERERREREGKREREMEREREKRANERMRGLFARASKRD